MANTNELSPVYNYAIKDFFALIWQGKLLIIVLTCIFAIASVVYSINIVNTYRPDILLESARNSESSLGKSAAQLGQLANLAGIGISGGKDPTATDLAMLESRIFLSQFITENKLLIPLFAASQWNPETDQLLFDNKIYNSETKQWTRKVSAPFEPKPTILEAVDQFNKNIEIQHDTISGLVTISYEFISPVFAKQILEKLINQFNSYVKSKEIKTINANILYLETQAEALTNAGMKSVFYSLLEEQQKKVMLASSSDEYVFRVIDPAVTPIKKFAPKRAIICILGTLAGFFLGVLIILLRQFFKG